MILGALIGGVACTTSSRSYVLTCVAATLLLTASGRALLVPIHNLLSPSITIFGVCRQDDCHACARVHVNSDSIWPACQHPLTLSLDWSPVSVSRIVDLVVGCVVELSAALTTTTLLSSGAGLPAASDVPLLEPCMGPLLKLIAVCPGEMIELVLPVCTTSLFTVSSYRVHKSRGFAPARLQHAMQPFWPLFLI